MMFRCWEEELLIEFSSLFKKFFNSEEDELIWLAGSKEFTVKEVLFIRKNGLENKISWNFILKIKNPPKVQLSILELHR